MAPTEYTPGIADWLVDQVPRDVSDARAAELLAEHTRENGFPLPDSMGAHDVLEKLVLWVRSRQLISDEVETRKFRWFDFHVPPGGKGSLGWTREVAAASGLSVRLFGTGLGGKATFRLSVTRDLDDCRVCQSIHQKVRVRVRRYKGQNRAGASVTETTTDPLEWLGQEPEDRKDCCGLRLSDVDLFKFDVVDEDRVDGRQTSALQKKSQNVTLGLDRSAGLKLGPDIGLDLELSQTLECKLAWEFPAGPLYVPYVERNHRSLPPRWSIG